MPLVQTTRLFAVAAVLVTAMPQPLLADDTPQQNQQNAEIVLASGEQAAKDHVRSQVFLSADRLPAGGMLRFVVVLDVEDGWHINTNPAKPEFVVPTTVTVKSKHATKATKIDYPQGRDFSIEGFDEPVSVYEGRVLLFGTLAVPSHAARQTEELTVEIKFQACNDRQCLAPKTAKLVGKVPVAAPGERVNPINEMLFERDPARKERRGL
jgi:hypothetical protein